MKITQKYVPSVDGIHNLFIKVYTPDTTTIGILGNIHGMTEHKDRYDRLMSDIAELGYVVYGHNHLGHKDSVRDDTELGFISSSDGWDLLCRDSARVYESIKDEYGALPFTLLGHSMGSFIARLTAERYITPDKLIIMGTGGPNPLAPVGLSLIKIIKAAKGERYVSPLIYSMAFGSYNNKFAEDGKQGWLTKDASVRDAYAADKYCTFKFSVSAMADLMTLLYKSNKKEWAENIAKKHFPVLLVSGSEDPVGDYGRGVARVYTMLAHAGADVTLRLYDGYRHEILNDASYDEVLKDILKFI